MKVITKILLLNWHYISYVCLDINKNLNFFTGKTGAGKSTVLDAIQLLVLGDTRGDFFNKAASGESKRTLIEYLRGMNQENDKAGKGYLRNDDFSSYIVMEFNDTAQNKSFCLGVIFDVYSKSNQYNHLFFYINNQLPSDHFVLKDIPLSIDQFKEMYKGKAEIYTTNKEYRDKFIYQHMGKIRPEFFDTFKKSVSFTPPKNIREFIERFVCEEIEISIDEMRENVRLYKQFGTKMDGVKEQITLLRSINERFNVWKKLNDDKDRIGYIVDRAEVEQLTLDILDMKTQLARFQAALSKLDLEIIKIETQSTELEQDREILRNKINDSETNKLYNNIQLKIESLQQSIDQAQKFQQRFQTMGADFNKWIDCLNDWDKISTDPIEDEMFLRKNIPSLKDCNLLAAAFTETNNFLDKCKNVILREFHTNDSSIRVVIDELSQIKSLITEIEQGKKYPSWLIDAQKHIKDELCKAFNEEVVVHILADLIDIKDNSWVNAIEGFINTQKLYFIIAPKYYDQAGRIYEKMDNSKFQKHKVGLVNIKAVLDLKPVIEKGSLAEEIQTQDEYSKIYCAFLMGRIFKCEKVDDLKNYRSAITRDCHTYKNFVLSSINSIFYSENAFIGMGSRQIQIATLQKKAIEKSQKLQILKDRQSILSRYQNLKIYDISDIERLADEQLEIDNLANRQTEQESLCEELHNIDLTYVITLTQKKEIIEQEILIIKEQISNFMNIDKVDIQSDIRSIEKEMPERIAEFDVKNQEFDLKYENAWIVEVGNDSYNEAFSKTNDVFTLKSRYKSKQEAIAGKVENAFNDLMTVRQCAERKGLSGFDIFGKSNIKYDDLLDTLSQIALPEIMDKIKQQEVKAFTQLKEDLLYKLRDGIEKTEDQINFLNRTLSNMDFGKDKYQFRIAGSKKHNEIYRMLKDDMLYQPGSLMSDIFEETHKDAINTLFEFIADTGNRSEELGLEQIEEIKKNIIKYTDYKTYLDFDMTVTSNGMESDLSKTMNKNSGGETQMPFYISVLASFIQLYRMDKAVQEDTLRLLMFDEAFSKMDEEYISKSIELIKKLGFQAIIVAPDNKIRSIGPLSEKIFYVQNENKKRITICSFEKEDKDKLINSL